MSSASTNQAMEPVGIGPLTSPQHGDHVHIDSAHRGPDATGLEPRAPATFTGAEIRKALGYLAIVLGAIVGIGLVMATGVALLHKLFKLFVDDPVLAAAWGNAVGTVLTIVLVFVMVLATLLTMGERKWSAFIQDRVGPNRARLPIPGLKDKALFGLPHIAADVVKMLTKEEVVPALGSKFLFHAAPAIAFAPAFVLFAVIPMSPTFTWLGESITMQVASVDQGLLFVLAAASISVFGVTLAGWSSNNKYALMGGIRASAQMVSYEVTLGLTLVGLMIVYGTLRLDTMSVLQGFLPAGYELPPGATVPAGMEGGYVWGWLPAWGVFFQPLAIFAYFAAASAEIKRAPFDMPEGESEIVGFFLEYSGLKFGIFMISEFVEVVVFAALFTVLFFGSYHLPWGEAWIAANLGTSALAFLQFLTFMVKVVFFCWLSLAVRWTFPRFRYDQVMDLGWKLLLPVSLANVVLTGLAVLWAGTEGAALLGLVQLGFVAFWLIGSLRIRRTGDESALATEPAPAQAVAASH